jgi:hypothetical protein
MNRGRERLSDELIIECFLYPLKCKKSPKIPLLPHTPNSPERDEIEGSINLEACRL